MNGDQIVTILLAVLLSVLSIVGLLWVTRRFVNPGMLLLGLPLPEEIQRLIDLATAAEHEVRSAEIATLRKEIVELKDRVEWLMQLITERKQATPPPVIETPPAALPLINYRQMLVAVGDEPGLQIDLAIFRRNRILFERLNPVTLTGFEAIINRARRAGRPLLYIHLAVHTSAAGCQFADGLATPEWLSERLRGTKVLLIAGCESTEIGDWLGGIAEYVITMAEPVSLSTSPALSDIGLFAEALWAAIYDGKDPQTAFYAALEVSPSWVGEIANIHSGVRK